jgi:hypothetical protein
MRHFLRGVQDNRAEVRLNRDPESFVSFRLLYVLHGVVHRQE